MKASSVIMVLVCVMVVVAEAEAKGNSTRYTFYRSMGMQGGGDGRRTGGADTQGRRVFGGSPASLQLYAGTCALLDRYWSVRCSAAWVAPRWAVTAAHCVTPKVAYIKYNSRRPSSPDGDVAAVHYLYRHPAYEVVHEDDGHGTDVTLLHHDVGLVRARNEMVLATPLTINPLDALRLYNPVDLKNEDIQVLGFGRTETSPLGEELFWVRLRAVGCSRGAWFHCVCGVASAGAKLAKGVCSGDSGGPVVYNGVQVGVTSMGPVECASLRSQPPEGATSVFTTLYQYADVVRSTINDTDSVLAMRRLSRAPPSPAVPFPLLLLLLPPIFVIAIT